MSGLGAFFAAGLESMVDRRNAELGLPPVRPASGRSETSVERLRAGQDRLGRAWADSSPGPNDLVPSSVQAGFGFRGGPVGRRAPIYLDAQGRVYDASTGRPMSGIGPGRVRYQGAVGGAPTGASQSPAPSPSTPVLAPAGGRTVPISQPIAAGRARNLSVAAQNAGLPASSYESYQSTPEFAAARAASDAALAAREAQGGRGYLSAAPASTAPMAWRPDASAFSADGAGFDPAAFTGSEPLAIPGMQASDGAQRWMPAPGTFSQVDTSGPSPFSAEALAAAASMSIPGLRPANSLPDTSNPATQAYWDRADIKAWAGANGKLAARLRERHGLPPLQQGGGVDLSTAVRPQPGAPTPAAQLEAFNAEAPIAPAAELAAGAQPSWLPANPMAPPTEEEELARSLQDRYLNLARRQLIGSDQ